MISRYLHRVCLSLAAVMFLLPLQVNAETEVRLPALSDEHCTIGIHTSELAVFNRFQERPGLLGWFETWFGEIQEDKLRACGQGLAVPMITWEPLGVSMEGIESGEFDAYLTAYFETIRALCPDNEVLIRFAHEMESRPQYQFSWYEWQGLDPAVYISAWKHVVDLGREICPNIKWVWSPNHADQYAEPYYPGDPYVDYVGVTLNLTVKEYYDIHYVDALDYYRRAGTQEGHKKYGRPQIISEFAYANDDLSERAAYFKSLLPLIEENPQLKAILFYDDDNTSLRDFRFSDEPELAEIFEEIIRKVHQEGSES